MGVYYSLGCDTCKRHVEIGKMCDGVDTGVLTMGFLYKHYLTCKGSVSIIDSNEIESDEWTDIECEVLEYMNDSSIQEVADYMTSLKGGDRGIQRFAYNKVRDDIYKRMDKVEDRSNSAINDFKKLIENLRIVFNLNDEVSYKLQAGKESFEVYEMAFTHISAHIELIKRRTEEKISLLNKPLGLLEKILYEMSKDIFTG
jgi:hypothetical protein